MTTLTIPIAAYAVPLACLSLNFVVASVADLCEGLGSHLIKGDEALFVSVGKRLHK